MIQLIKLSGRRRLLVALVIAAVTTALLVVDRRLQFLPGNPPRYTLFGVDRHPSVMRLLESNVLVTRLDDEDEKKNVQTVDTVGVFIVVDPSTFSQPLSLPGTANDSSLCFPSYRYQIFIINSATFSTPTSEDRKQYGGNDVNSTSRHIHDRCVEAGAASVIIWHVQLAGGIEASLVADLVTEAYIDNVTWYDVIFLRRMTSPFPAWSRWPPNDVSLPSNVGVALKTSDACTRVVFHRTHLDIFGDSWPQWLRTGPDVATYLKDVYIDSAYTGDTVVLADRAWLRRYTDAINSSPGQSCLPCQLRDETGARSRNIISMSLYGDDPRYTIGAVRNAQRLPVVFPGWTLRFYYRDVLPQLVDRLRELGAELRDVARLSRVPPMLWRMSALDDPSVDLLLSRDADSRLTDRDAADVNAWLVASRRPSFHCIRDHPSHAAFAANGGMWGARRHQLVRLVGGQSIAALMANFGDSYLDDMKFLEQHIWTPLSTQFQHEVYCHDSVSCDEWVGAHPSVTARQWPGEHVGQVFDAWSRPRQIDVDVLLSANRNAKCESPEIQSNNVTVGHDKRKTSVGPTVYRKT